MNKVYHYTSLSALFSILQNKEFWLSHSKLLNDADEIVWFKEIFIQEVNKSDIPEYRKKLYIHLFEKAFNEYLQNAYVLSFSLEADKTSLWSDFSEKEGCCIEIDIEAYIKQLLGHHYNINYELSHDIYYTLTPKEDRLKFAKESLEINDLLNTAIIRVMWGNVLYEENATDQIIKKLIINLEGTEDLDDNIRFDTKEILIEQVINYMFFYKKDGFSSEKEYRLVINLRNNEACKAFSFFRIKDNLLIPYIKLKFDLKDKLFSRIIVNPKSDYDSIKSGFELFFKFNEIDNIPIVKSNMNHRY